MHKEIEMKVIKTLDELRKDAEVHCIPWNAVVIRAGMNKTNAYKLRNPRETTLLKLTRALNLIKTERGAK